MKLKLVGIGICMFIGLASLKAQDSHFSQYYYAPLNQNPAMAGVFSGKLRLGLNYRDQWSTINDAYKISAFSVDGKFKSIGLGLQALNETAGNGAFYRNNVNMSFSVDFAPESASSHFILGFQGGIIQQGIDGSKITTETGTQVESQNYTDLDFGVGALWFSGRGDSKLMPFIGASVFHVNGPQAAFDNAETVLPLRSSVHGGIRIHAGQGFDIVPNGQFMVQGGARNVTAGLYISYALNNLGSYFLLGGSYRVDDAVIPFAGLKLGPVTAGVSYDFVTGSLSDVVTDAQTLELSIQYIIPNKKYKTRYICPRL